jgi:hypothetical protein
MTEKPEKSRSAVGRLGSSGYIAVIPEESKSHSSESAQQSESKERTDERQPDRGSR